MNRPVLWGALFVSLALNVFVFGAFVGSRFAGERPHGSAPAIGAEPRQRNPVIAAVRTLSPEAQAAWRAQTPAFLKTYGADLRETRRVARSAMTGLGAEPFDPAIARAALERARAVEHQTRLAMDRRLVAFAATLSPTDRARFAEALARPRRDRRPPGPN